MINIFVFPDDIIGYVWDVEDWLKMRTDYRIIGKLVGKSSQKQGTLSGLPVLLLPEEITLMKDKILARIVQHPTSINKLECNSEDVEEFSDNLKKTHIERRKKELEDKIDLIIQGKKRKNPLYNEDRQKIIDEELEKTKLLCEKNTHLLLKEGDILIDESKLIDAQWTYPKSEKEKLRYEVFKDLWEKNFRLTCGLKFGGDFLCYEGDPLHFHASYIIACKAHDAKITCKELISLGRIGTSTRKIVVIAAKESFDNESKVIYQCLEWLSDKDKSEKLTKKLETLT